MAGRWWALVAACSVTFMLLMNVTIVLVALPDAQAALHASFTETQWIVGGYALALAATLLGAGALGDAFGRRRVFGLGIVCFLGASLTCGLAPSATLLVVGRVLQGTAAAVLLSTSLAIISEAFPGQDRGRAFGYWGATVGLATTLGPLVGGLLTAVSWRAVFLINLPIGLAALVVLLLRAPRLSGPVPTVIDWLGHLTLAIGLGLITFALTTGRAAGWGSSRTLLLLAGGAAGLAAFVAAERLQRAPMLDLGLFRRRPLLGTSFSGFSLHGSLFALYAFLVLYIQNVLGYSPLETGLAILPAAGANFLVAPVSSRLADAGVSVPVRIGAGLGLVALGLCLTALAVEGDSSWKTLLPGLAVCGTGTGIANPAIAATALGVVHQPRSGMASGLNQTFRQLGNAIGIAVLGTLFQGDYGRLVERGVAEAGLATSPRALELARNGNVAAAAGAAPGDTGPAFEAIVGSAFGHALSGIVLVGAGLALLGALLACLLVRGPAVEVAAVSASR